MILPVIVLSWFTMGFLVWCASTVHAIFKRQDRIVKWINESITGKDLVRDQWPLLEEQKYPFLAIFKSMITTLVLWPIVLNNKLSGW